MKLKYITIIGVALALAGTAVAAKGDRPKASEMDTIVYGHPVIVLDGKPFVPPAPVVAKDTPDAPIEPVPYLPQPQPRGPLDPVERIDAGHKAFEEQGK